MAYVIIELQTDENGSTATPPLKTEKEHDKAKSVFHQTAASASISSVPIHTVLWLTETGEQLDKEVCVHQKKEEEKTA